MDYKRIILLVEKYWQTETTLEEEAELRAFFSKPHSNLPKELKEAAPLFQYFHKETQRNWPVEKVRTSLWRQWKYAAVLVVAAGGFLFWHLHERQQEIITRKQHEVNNPQRALEETRKALQLLAKNLNKGTSKMEKLSYFNEAASMMEGKE